MNNNSKPEAGCTNCANLIEEKKRKGVGFKDLTVLKPILYAILVLSVSFFSGCDSHTKNTDHDHEHESHTETSEADHHDSEHEHEHEGSITLSAHQAEEFGVETTILQPAPFSEIIKVSGRIEPSASGRVTVTARRSGIITLAPNITVGTQIASGATVAVISSKGVQGGDINATAISNRDAALRELERLRPLHTEGLVTTATLNEAERVYKEAAAAVGGTPGNGSEKAPFSGIISALFVSSGDYVETGTPIASITRDTRLTLRADVPERYATKIPGIRSANFRPDCAENALSLSSLNGHLISGGNISSAEKGYIPVFFSFTATPETPPGAFAEVYLIGSKLGNVLAIPRSAIIEMQGNTYVYVRIPGHDDAYEKRLVHIGGSDGMNVEILSGLTEGDNVVTKGSTIIRMAETSAIAPPGHSHNH